MNARDGAFVGDELHEVLVTAEYVHVDPFLEGHLCQSRYDVIRFVRVGFDGVDSVRFRCVPHELKLRDQISRVHRVGCPCIRRRSGA